MEKEPASLPASLTFGPLFMILGLAFAQAGWAKGWATWMSIGLAVFGAFQLSSGVIWLLRAARSSAQEVARLRERLNELASAAIKS